MGEKLKGRRNGVAGVPAGLWSRPGGMMVCHRLLCVLAAAW